MTIISPQTPPPARRPWGKIILWSWLGVLGLGFLYALWAWNQPLGQQLPTLDATALAERPTLTPPTTPEASPTVEVLTDPEFANTVAQATALPTSVPPATPAASATPAATPATTCGTGVMTIMVLGSDTRLGDYKTGRTDFIRAVRVDFDKGTARLLSIPRDLWVPMPYLADYGIIEARVNSAYSYGNYYQLPGGGVNLMAETLKQNFGLTFDHYLVVNFDAVEKGVDAIGGVDVYVPKDVDGTLQYQPYFKAGQYHMDGHTLMQYVRIRFSDNDLYRMDRQNQVLMAIREKLLRPEIVGSIPSLTTAMLELVYTDLTPAQASTLACFGKEMDTANLLSLKIGAGHDVVGHTTAGGAQVLLPIWSEIQPLLDQFTAP